MFLLWRIGEVRHGVNDHKLYRCLGRFHNLEADIPKTDDVGLSEIETTMCRKDSKQDQPSKLLNLQF